LTVRAPNGFAVELDANSTDPRERFAYFAIRQLLSDLAERDAVIAACAQTVGASVTADCSADFRAMLPDEIKAAVAERDAVIADYRDEFAGLCHTLSVGSEGRPEMTASDWRKRVDHGIDMLIGPLQQMIAERDARIVAIKAALDREAAGWEHKYDGAQERAERAEAELARLRGQEPVAWMWNDELGCHRALAGSKKPIWLESSASAEYIRQANLRPLYAEPMPAKEAK
jgi:hypothetical protein